LLLTHVPPGVASLSVLVRPLQMVKVPVIGATVTGVPLTDIVSDATAVPHGLVIV